jgi:PEP-CTERM motif
MQNRRLSMLTSAAVLALAAATSAQATSGFGSLLSENSTGVAGSAFLGAPGGRATNVTYAGLGREQVTYDFGVGGVINRPGLVDFNVYETDFGVAEFNVVDILVSVDGTVFTSVDSTMATVVRITGDSGHLVDDFAKSFDLGDLAAVRYIRVDGTSNSNPGGNNGFDLDAVGVHQPVPEPGTWALMFAGLAAVGAAARQRRG